MEKMLTTRTAAEFAGMSLGFFVALRRDGLGPIGYKPGGNSGHYRYSKTDVADWLDKWTGDVK